MSSEREEGSGTGVATSGYCRKVTDNLYSVKIGPLRMTEMGLMRAILKLPNSVRRQGRTGYRWAGEEWIDGERWGRIELVPQPRA